MNNALNFQMAWQEQLQKLQDPVYQKFSARLMPEVPEETVLGIRSPQLKTLAGMWSSREKQQFCQNLPHDFHEENVMHVMLLNEYGDPEEAFRQLDLFLPYVNTWAVTDGLTFPRIQDDILLEKAEELLKDSHSYTVRLGILWIMKRGIQRNFDVFRIQRALKVQNDSHEVQMAKAWLLCEGMIYRKEWFEPVLDNFDFQDPVLYMAISKCIDSRRIDPPAKERLKLLRSQKRSQQKRK